MNRTLLTVLSVAWVILVGSHAVANETRFRLPVEAFPYAPVASVRGLEALWNNPGSLPFTTGSFYQTMVEEVDKKGFQTWGSGAGRQGFAAAFRRIKFPDDETYKEYIWGGGIRVGRSGGLGASYRHIPNGPVSFDNQHAWNAGVTVQTDPQFTLAATFANLNRARIEGERSQVEQRYGIGYRPHKDLVTLAVDMALGSSESMREAEFIYAAEVRPVGGLSIGGFVSSEKYFGISARLNFRRQHVASQTRFNSSGRETGTTYMVGGTTERQRSLVPYGASRILFGLGGNIQENPPQPIWGRRSSPFLSTLLGLYRAADDRSVREVILFLNNSSLGLAQAQELHDALYDLRAHGKRVLVHLTNPGNIAYYVAAAADSIFVSPANQVSLVGLRAELTFYAATLEKLGVRADFVRIGNYKTAAEAFTDSSASSVNREQVNRLLDQLFDQMVTRIAKRRSLSVDSVRSLIDRAPFGSEDALGYGLVDRITAPEDYRDYLNKYAPPLRSYSLTTYMRDSERWDRWGPVPQIAIVVAEGEIGGTPVDEIPFQPGSSVTPSGMRSSFAAAKNNPKIRGVLFRIDSPGGVAVAGDEIWRAASYAGKRKPMVVSMANLAASGGYQIAMGAPTVIANEGTVTGSIGIFGGKLDLSGLYEKIALGKELYTRGAYAGMLTTIRPFSPEERERYLDGLTRFYRHFVGVVAENRKLPTDSIDRVGQGQVWTGLEAKAIGLVDGVGGFREALDSLVAQLPQEEYEFVFYPRSRPLISLGSRGLLSGLSRAILGDDLRPPASIVETAREGLMLTRLPYDLVVE